MSFNGVAVVNEMLEALTAGDIDRMVQVFTPDITVYEAENLPYPGTYVGVDAFRNDLLGKMLSSCDLVVKEREIVPAGDRVMVSMTGEFTSKFTGRSVAMPMIEVYSFKDGKISEVDVFYKDTLKMMALFNER